MDRRGFLGWLTGLGAAVGLGAKASEIVSDTTVIKINTLYTDEGIGDRIDALRNERIKARLDRPPEYLRTVVGIVDEVIDEERAWIRIGSGGSVMSCLKYRGPLAKSQFVSTDENGCIVPAVFGHVVRG